jgi:hypothetical protein
MSATTQCTGSRFLWWTGCPRLLRHAQQPGFLAFHQQELARRGGDAAAVHADDARACLEHPAHGLGRLLAACGLGAVDLGDDGREHRRPGRHLHHLHVGTETLAGLHAVADLDLQVHHCARHLGRRHGQAHRFDHRFIGSLAASAGALGHHHRQAGRGGGCRGCGPCGAHQRPGAGGRGGGQHQPGTAVGRRGACAGRQPPA